MFQSIPGMVASASYCSLSGGYKYFERGLGLGQGWGGFHKVIAMNINIRW